MVIVIPNFCLRCHKASNIDAVENTVYCSHCDMMYYAYRSGAILVLRNFINPNDRLFWYFDHEYCQYTYDNNYTVNRSSVKLDWLPLDITAERFKSLLIFI